MSVKPKAATVSAAVKRLLMKRHRAVVYDLVGDALIRRTTIQAVRYLLDLGIAAHEVKIERDRRIYAKWNTEFLRDYVVKQARDVVSGGDP
jgi:hypothetical protein